MTISNLDVLKLSITWRMNLQDQQVNVLHVRCGDITTQTDDEIRDDLTEYLDDLYSDVVADMVNNLTHFGTTVFNETTGNPELPLPVSTALDGADSGVMLPWGVSTMVFGRTGINHKIARKFLPTGSTGTISDGFIASGALGRANLYAAKLAATFVATNGTAIRAGVWNASDGFHNIIQAQASINPAYQRRRRQGRGA